MIQPLSLPSGAGLDYGQGDIRHFSEGDDQSAVGLSNPTRYAAQRDNILSAKVNEVVEAVNNHEQFVPLPIIPTSLPPSDEQVVLNYRIPAGFESRVLNAAVATTPASTDIELDIFYNAGFGGVTGSNIVSTSTEFSGGVQFYQSGEFIAVLKNKGGISLSAVASIMLTIRPIGSVGSLLVGSVIQGDAGPPGKGGPIGPRGLPGTGGAGSPGMVWVGEWTAGTTYTPNQVVSVTVSSAVSSYICRVGNISGVGNSPTVDAVTWNPVSIGGKGDKGDHGDPGSGAAPTYASNGLLVPYTSTAISTTSGYYSGLASTGNFSVTEFSVVSTTAGMCFSSGTESIMLPAGGTLNITLPTSAARVGVQYATTNFTVTAVSQETSPVESGNINLLSINQSGANSWAIISNSAFDVPASLTFFGAMAF